MSFLSPLFLLGALAVALPVVFHLVHRTTRERTVFSSLLFLEPTPPRFSRRSRLEHLLLLALRCLAIGLLAVGFSRPFFKKPVTLIPAANTGRRLLILLDTSASMRRANLWSDAVAKVEAIAKGASPSDQVALFSFARQSTPLATFEQWNSTPVSERGALVAGKVSALGPGWESTPLASAMIGAAESLAETGGAKASGPGQIILVTDLQEGCRLEGLQGYEWPRNVSVNVEPLRPAHPGNASLQLIADAETAAPAREADVVRVRVSNSDPHREQFRLGWAGPDGRALAGKPVEVYVPAGRSETVSLPAPGLNASADRIKLEGDDEPFDDTVFAVPPETQHLQLCYLGGESAKDARQPLYFLERAVQETRRQKVTVLPHDPATLLSASEAREASLFVITSSLGDQNIGILRHQIESGTTALLCLQSADIRQTLARLAGVEQLELEEARPANYALLADIDFRHPLFAPFADPRFSDFTKIHFWKYQRLDAARIPSARVVSKFDNGDPALLELPVGKGRLLVLTSGWQPDDSQLALSTKFVPLVYSLIETYCAGSRPPTQYFVGMPIPVMGSTDAGASPVRLRTPDDSEISLPAGETNFSRTFAPGIYTLVSSQPPRRFAVNLEPSESRTAPLAVDELERLGVPISRPTPVAIREREREVRLQNSELENRQKLWRWLLAGTLGVLLAETWLAGHAARAQRPLGGKA